MKPLLVVLLVVLAGCPESRTPTCPELGCGSAVLCTRGGVCTCGGERCEAVQPDGGTP